MLEVLAHPDLPHEFVFVPVHPRQLPDVSKDVLEAVCQLWGEVAAGLRDCAQPRVQLGGGLGALWARCGAGRVTQGLLGPWHSAGGHHPPGRHPRFLACTGRGCPPPAWSDAAPHGTGGRRCQSETSSFPTEREETPSAGGTGEPGGGGGGGGGPAGTVPVGSFASHPQARLPESRTGGMRKTP